jgi:membrane protein
VKLSWPSPRTKPDAGAVGAVSAIASRARFARGAVDPAAGVLRGAALEATRSQLPQMAAALAYRTIFGLIPVMVVALVGVKVFVFQSDERLADAIRSALDYTGLGDIAIVEDPDFVGPPLPDAPTGLFSGGRLDEWIQTLVRNVSSISFEAITAVGLAALLYAAISMLVEIERAFNQIYRVPQGRSWARRVLLYWTLLTLGPLALALTFVLASQFRAWIWRVAEEKQLLGESGDIIGSGLISIGALGYLATVLVSMALLLLMYTSVPNTRVRLYPAMAGAFVGAVLWEAAKWGFTQYVVVSGSSSYGRLYGSIALIPLFLMWVYFTWVIILFGLQVSYYIQHGRLKTRAQPLVDLPRTIVEPSSTLTVLGVIGRGFESGKPVQVPAIVKSTRLHEGVVRLVVAKLAEQGLLHRVDAGGSADEEDNYTLARPPSSIRVADVLKLGFEISEATDDGVSSVAEVADAPESIAATLRKAQLDAAGNRSLADVMRLSDTPAPATPARPIESQTPGIPVTRKGEPQSATMNGGEARTSVRESITADIAPSLARPLPGVGGSGTEGHGTDIRTPHARA